jgi:hypothetical protein
MPGNLELKNMSKRGLKRLRKVSLNLKWGDTNPSSESKEEHGHGVHLGSVSTTDTPEEKERRQNRFNWFDRGKGSGWGRGAAVGSASSRRATAL